MSAPLVTVADDGRVRRITLASPETRNALSRELLVELDAALRGAAASTARVIVLDHVAPAFCSGLDLRQASGGVLDLGPLATVLESLLATRQPVVAVIDGPVRAGGLGIMAACDVVVVAESVTFAFTEVKIGAVPAIISATVFRRVSATRLARYYLTGGELNADEARALGLVDVVAADSRSAGESVINEMLAAGPRALEATTSLLRGAARGDDMNVRVLQRLSESVFASDEAREGMASFLAKRPPSWRDAGR
ncbi:MAG: enoyl-CoA hydratase-related protein [Ilumatobacteraceae bacterium]